MRRWALTFAAVSACAVAVAACRQLLPMPQNAYLQPRNAPIVSQSTADARQFFDHAVHAKTFAVVGVQCMNCHRFDVAIESGDPNIYTPLSAHALIPGSNACHFCHEDGPGKMAAAPKACTTCHTNLAPLKPDNHQVAWLQNHGTEAQGNPVECENCHRQSYCMDCHNARDTIQTVQHERNFRFIHGIYARTDPMQCSACHREDFCINCHIQSKVMVQP